MAKATGTKAPVAKIVMENVNSPGGHVVRVDADKYNAMRRAILAALPKKAPGLTVAELKQRVLPLLPEELFPGGQGGLVAEGRPARSRSNAPDCPH